MRKTINAFFLLAGVVTISSCSSQPSSPFAPEEGTYLGYHASVNVGYQYGYNFITGFGMQPSTQVNAMPAPMGDLIIKQSGGNKGSYKFTKTDWSGTWEYSEADNKLSFSGPLKEAIEYYHAGKGWYTIRLHVGKTAKDKQGVFYRYSRKATKAFPKPATPNKGITGIFTLKPDNAATVLYDAAGGKTKASFNGKMATTNKNGVTICVGYTNDPHNYAITLFNSKGEATNYTPQTIAGWNLRFTDYKFGPLANDNKTAALLGRTPDSYKDLNYTPGENSIAIIDLSTGKQKGIVAMHQTAWIKPFFLNDGRLVYCPKEGGVAITDAAYTSSKIIYTNPVNAFAVSPDGTKLVVSDGLHFYLMNLDGSNKKQIICTGEPLEVAKAQEVSDMCFSTDGKMFAICYGPQASYNIIIVPLDGGAYKFLNDEDGEPVKQVNPFACWY